jgi:hypothetical protein
MFDTKGMILQMDLGHLTERCRVKHANFPYNKKLLKPSKSYTLPQYYFYQTKGQLLDLFKDDGKETPLYLDENILKQEDCKRKVQSKIKGLTMQDFYKFDLQQQGDLQTLRQIQQQQVRERAKKAQQKSDAQRRQRAEKTHERWRELAMKGREPAFRRALLEHPYSKYSRA